MPDKYKPARADLKIPMPDRGNALMPESGVGVDMSSPYYRRLVGDGDIVKIGARSAAPSGKGKAEK